MLTYQRTECAVSILNRVVTVIPCTSILHCSKSVVEAVFGCDRTLGHAIDSVHVHRLPLSDSMPMHAGTVVGQIVGYYDGNVLIKLARLQVSCGVG
jgi:hypothetical protein